MNSNQPVSPNQKNGLPSAVARNLLLSETFNSGVACAWTKETEQQVATYSNNSPMDFLILNLIFLIMGALLLAVVGGDTNHGN